MTLLISIYIIYAIECRSWWKFYKLYTRSEQYRIKLPQLILLSSAFITALSSWYMLNRAHTDIYAFMRVLFMQMISLMLCNFGNINGPISVIGTRYRMTRTIIAMLGAFISVMNRGILDQVGCKFGEFCLVELFPVVALFFVYIFIMNGMPPFKQSKIFDMNGGSSVIVTITLDIVKRINIVVSIALGLCLFCGSDWIGLKIIICLPAIYYCGRFFPSYSEKETLKILQHTLIPASIFLLILYEIVIGVIE